MELEGRLINACAWAYAIQRTSPGMPDLPPYAAGSGLAPPVRCFATGSSRIDAALVGLDRDGVVLAFRGTLPPTDREDPLQVMKDWMQDLEVELVAGEKLPGLVHHGFLGALDTLWDDVAAAVTALMAASPVKRLLVTGHSKGGAMAHLAAARFALTSLVHGSDITVRSFEGAHPGDPAFAQAYARLVPDALRYEYADDLVPHLPPSLMFRSLFRAEIRTQEVFAPLMPAGIAFDYAPAGALRFIDWNGEIREGSSALLDAERLAHLADRIARAQWPRIIADHSIAAGTVTYGVVTAATP